MAGGLNLYGFADGDPVNYSDPFGLWPGWLDRLISRAQAYFRNPTTAALIVAGTELQNSAFRAAEGTAEPAEIGAPEEDISAAAGLAEEAPEIIYREGTPSPSNLTPRSADEGKLSFRTSLSNPVPKEGQPVFRKEYFGLSTAKLPKGSVVVDNTPPGHAYLQGVSVEAAKDAVVVRGKFPPQGPQ